MDESKEIAKSSFYKVLFVIIKKDVQTRMRNLYIENVGCDYYVSIAKQLHEKGFNLKILGSAESSLYRPKTLYDLQKNTNSLLLNAEDYNLVERFEKIFDPDYSIFNMRFFSDISYYEKLFLMTTDRLSFEPISQINRLRLFHKFIAHAHKLLVKEKIDSILFFGTPHGAWSIALIAVSESLGIDIRYTDWVGISPDLSTVENAIYIRKKYHTNRK